MAIIVFILFVWMICKGIKALFRSRPVAYEPVPVENKISKSLAALEALQAQRDQIQETISYIKESITTAETPEKTIQYMDRLSSLYGKLAIVENKISKLMN